MFDSLSDRLNGVFGKLTSRGRLSDKDIDAALREVRMALLEADVDFKVARQFISNIKEKASDEKVFSSLTPGQTVVKIVQEELATLAEAAVRLVDPDVKPQTARGCHPGDAHDKYQHGHEDRDSVSHALPPIVLKGPGSARLLVTTDQRGKSFTRCAWAAVV